MNLSSGDTSHMANMLELEGISQIDHEFLYNGTRPVMYFMRKTVRSLFFSHNISNLEHKTFNTELNFGHKVEYSIARTCDFFHYVFLWLRIDEIKFEIGNRFAGNGTLRTCQKFSHNLIELCEWKYSTTVIQSLQCPTVLDYNYNFMMNATEKENHSFATGDKEYANSKPYAAGQTLPRRNVILQLPFDFAKSYSNSIVIAALPFVEVVFRMSLRHWEQLYVVDDLSKSASLNTYEGPPSFGTDVKTAPKIDSGGLWGEHIYLKKDQRTALLKTSRDVLIDHYQYIQIQGDIGPVSGAKHMYTLNVMGPVKVFYFGYQNKTLPNERSNYSMTSPYVDKFGTVPVLIVSDAEETPIDNVTLRYNTTDKLRTIGAEIFRKVIGPRHFGSKPEHTGMYAYSYSIDNRNPNPTGSFNYSRVNKIELHVVVSKDMLAATRSTALNPQTFEFVFNGVTWNAMRIHNNSITMPTAYA